VVGASNRLPEDEALCALFDRFLMRVHCDNVAPEQLAQVLLAGWRLDMQQRPATSSVTVDDLRRLHHLLHEVDLTPLRVRYAELVRRLRHAGVLISDRRAVKLQRLLAASALLCGRLSANTTDLWVLRYVWDTEEQRDVLASLVQDALDQANDQERAASHPRASDDSAPDPEQLALGLEQIASQLDQSDLAETQRSYLRDQLGVLASRCQWVAQQQQRDFLDARIEELWDRLGGSA
jgi:MoxR-like ATPase